MGKLIYIGAAEAIAQVDTVTLSGTWAAADTATIKVNARSVTYTAGSSETPTTVAAALLLLCQASTAPEFKEITWTAVGAVITGTSVAGVPVTITASDTAAAGAATRAGVVTATGPWHWDNAFNWSTAAIPIAADEVYVEDPNMRILYGLPTSVSLGKFWMRYGVLGLPDRNANGYSEYRNTRAAFTCTDVQIGVQEGKGPALCRLDLLAAASVVVIFGSQVSNTAAAVDIVCNNASATATVISGQLSIADGGDETSTIGTVRCSTTGALTIGRGVTVTTCQSAGNTLIQANVTNLTVTSGTTVLSGTATVTTLTINGGTCIDKSSGTITTGVVGPGTLDCSQDNRTRTITNLQLKKGGVFRDPYNVVTVTNGVTLATDADLLTAS